MSPWSNQIPLLPASTWLPIGLAALPPVFLLAVVVPLSRRRTRGLATVLTLRTIVLLALGFAALPAVGTLAVVDARSDPIQAPYIGAQAARTAWLLLALSWVSLVVVGWTSWRQVGRSLAARIRTITAQIQVGRVEEMDGGRAVEVYELRELTESIARYIDTTLEQQRSSDERYRRLVELAPDGVFICSSASIKFANPAALVLTGARSRYDIVGVPIESFLEFEGPLSPDQPLSALRPARLTRVDGTVLYVEVAEIADSSGHHAFGPDTDDVRQYLVRDVTDRHLREAALAYRAEHDSLTGLANRARFEARLTELIDNASGQRRSDSAKSVAVLFLDLDDFKPVNDRYGHAAGDAVLVAVAERLQDATRGSDLIARLGGDEFAVLLEVRDRDEVSLVVNRILGALQRPIMFNGTELTVGASIGMADTHRDDGDSRFSGSAETSPRLMAAELLRAADIAMYAAKASGGSRCDAAPAAESPEPLSAVKLEVMA